MISLILKEIVRIKKRQRSPLSYIYKKKERKKISSEDLRFVLYYHYSAKRQLENQEGEKERR